MMQTLSMDRLSGAFQGMWEAWKHDRMEAVAMIVAGEFADEFAGAEFGDSRLSRRLQRIAQCMEERPTASIPAATDGRAEMEAAYRFFDNPSVTPGKILAPHRHATLERVRQCDVVILAQDTTELDLTRPTQQVVGTGPLTHDSRRGSYYHPLVAFSDEGLALGTVWHKHWVREKIHSGRSAADKNREIKKTPIEEKESIRWVEGLRAARDVAQQCPSTQCIAVSDSESDIYELLVEPRITDSGNTLQLIVRASSDRSLSESDEKLLATVRATNCLYTCLVDVSQRKQKTNVKKTSPRTMSRDARVATVEVRATTVTLSPPPRHDRKLAPVTINVVLVDETNPPDGQPPIQWILLTTLPIDSSDAVQKIVSYYCIRWQIEIYFKTLKSGCRVEERYFERMGRLENCLAVYLVVAWKILYLCRLGRDCPDLDCELVFTPSEWKAVYMIVKHQAPPATPPTLNEMIRMIASLGGYVIRKKTNPGTQTLWLGLQRVHDLSRAWTSFGPGSYPPNKKFSDMNCVVR